MKKYFLNVSIVLCLATAIFSCKKKEPTPAEPTSVTDIDGNKYAVVKICDKYWMSENLKTTRYNDGTAITTNLTTAGWRTTTTGAFSVYGANADNNTKYGKLYNWFAASNVKLAPIGWHVATEAEWKTLIDCLGGSEVAGGKMKSVSALWEAPNLGATNSSGFAGLPAGYKSNWGAYALIGKNAYLWASNQRNDTQGEYFLLSAAFASSNNNGATKQFGYSVRCVKD